MRTRILVSAVSFALVFGAFGAGAVFADPGTMGKSGSNPDGGGLDKPVTGTRAQGGGTQGPAYFDGNNGCGQDRRQDIAPDPQGGYDDNNGHCGKQTSSNENGSSAEVTGQEQAALAAEVHGNAGANAKGNAGANANGNVAESVSRNASAQNNAAAEAAVSAEKPAVSEGTQMAAAVSGNATAPAAVAGAAAVPAAGGSPGSSSNELGLLLLLFGTAASASGAGVLLRLRRQIV